MAKYRIVHTEYWNDPKVVEEMTPEDKFFFLYLLTNPQVSQIGIYQITKKMAAFEMGYSLESINSLFDRFINHHKIIKYNPGTREVAIKNWGKYNFIRGGKPIEDCVKKELSFVKDKSLIQFVGANIENSIIRKYYETFYVTDDVTDDVTEAYRVPLGGQKEKEKEKVVVVNPFDFYQQNFGVLNPFISEQIGLWVDDLNEELVIEAMKIALKQQKPWKYCEGILKGWDSHNIRSLEDVKAAEKQFKKKTDAPNQQPRPQQQTESVLAGIWGEEH